MVTAWRSRTVILMVILVLVGMLFLSYNLPSKLNFYSGEEQNNVRDATAQDFSRRQRQLEAYLEERAAVRRVKEVDCRKVLDGDKTELAKANATERVPVPLPQDTDILAAAGNCSNLVWRYGFLTDPLTDLEERFPIAFSILSYKQASQVVDLLRVIYRPQNFYCLHVDSKSAPEFRQAVEAVSSCFPNVFMASRSIEVHWGFYTVLEPEIVCMEDLWRKAATWKYFINLTGQEFLLRTNYELVRILSAFKGANGIQAFTPSKGTVNRWKDQLPSPYNISLYKGAVHIVASRAFVDYVLHSPEAKAFLEWCKPTRHPDEHFFNSLNSNPHLRIPGGQSKGNSSDGTAIVRYKLWISPWSPCQSRKFVRGICILNVLDLPLLHKGEQLVANKFYADFSRVALQCLAEDLHNRTTEQALGKSEFNVTFYEQLPFVRNRQWL